MLANGDPASAGVIQSAIESFAQELAGLMQQFLKLTGARTERLVMGGGFTSSRIGELAIGRASEFHVQGYRYAYVNDHAVLADPRKSWR